MSEILVDKLTGKTSAGDIDVTSEGGAVTMQLQQGLAKQWVYFNMSSSTAIDSLNTSSLTDNSTGVFLSNLTNAYSTTDYVATNNGNGYAGDSFNAQTTCLAKLDYPSNGIATNLYYVISYGGGALVDGKYNYAVTHGDLA